MIALLFRIVIWASISVPVATEVGLVKVRVVPAFVVRTSQPAKLPIAFVLQVPTRAIGSIT